MEKQKLPLEAIIGYILLTPPILSVIFFVLAILSQSKDKVIMFTNFIGTGWAGDWGADFEHGGGGGFTSALPIYFGLMAIAGAYLIRNSRKE